jgi:hypothetical protein
MASVPGRTATAQPVTPAPLVTKLHHGTALAADCGGGTSNGAQIRAPAHNKDAYRDEEVDQCAHQIHRLAHSPRDSLGTPACPVLPDLMGHVRPRFRYQDYPVAAPIHRGSASGRQ